MAKGLNPDLPLHFCDTTYFAGCEMELVGQRTVDLIVFDILKDHVSIHQPLPRVIASTYSPIIWRD